ncbi:hypothetical protein AWS52_10765 [Enterobacter cloacae subsp. cloacae]|nr:hypothetical protein AWS52_10765 [Enterobacter cloacae subsp. cloacae]
MKTSIINGSEVSRLSVAIHDRAFSRLSEGCSERVSRAISLAGTRQKEVEVTAVKQNRTYYRDTNPIGNKIHAVQRMKLSSKPLI